MVQVMIPKVIHYCWFGGNSLPPLAQKCIVSWQKFLPGYEIKCWDESNFDINIISYTKEAYEAKKYAFVSDYARFWILYRHGGLYFDTDVEVIRPMDDIIAAGPFMGRQISYKRAMEIIRSHGRIKDLKGRVVPNVLGVAPGLGLGVNPGLGLYKEILDFYSHLHFKNVDGSLNLKTVVDYTSDILAKHGMENSTKIQCIAGINVYPYDYFNPKSFKTGKIKYTSNTRTIHHFAASWMSPLGKLKVRIVLFIQPLLDRFK